MKIIFNCTYRKYPISNSISIYTVNQSYFYRQDLELALAKFYEPMRKAPNVPTPLKGRELVIFGNLEDICHFHRNIFLKELEKYETMPEDVGHCFVTWVSKYFILFSLCNWCLCLGLQIWHLCSLLYKQAKVNGTLSCPRESFLRKFTKSRWSWSTIGCLPYQTSSKVNVLIRKIL